MIVLNPLCHVYPNDNWCVSNRSWIPCIYWNVQRFIGTNSTRLIMYFMISWSTISVDCWQLPHKHLTPRSFYWLFCLTVYCHSANTQLISSQWTVNMDSSWPMVHQLVGSIIKYTITIELVQKLFLCSEKSSFFFVFLSSRQQQ